MAHPNAMDCTQCSPSRGNKNTIMILLLLPLTVTAFVPYPPPLAESFSEGSCVFPQTSRKLDSKWIVRQSTFYVPLASKYTYRVYAETLLSRSGVTDLDVKTMCLTLDFFPDGPGVNITTSGYDLRELKQTCPVIWRSQYTCLPIGGSPGTNPARARSTDNYVVEGDNQSYMLVVRCVDGFFKDYMLLTTRPVISAELYNSVTSSLKNLGFDTRKVQILSYDNCVNSDRFVSTVHHNHVVDKFVGSERFVSPMHNIDKFVGSVHSVDKFMHGHAMGKKMRAVRTHQPKIHDLQTYYAIIP